MFVRIDAGPTGLTPESGWQHRPLTVRTNYRCERHADLAASQAFQVSLHPVGNIVERGFQVIHDHLRLRGRT